MGRRQEQTAMTGGGDRKVSAPDAFAVLRYASRH